MFVLPIPSYEGLGMAVMNRYSEHENGNKFHPDERFGQKLIIAPSLNNNASKQSHN